MHGRIRPGEASHLSKRSLKNSLPAHCIPQRFSNGVWSPQPLSSIEGLITGAVFHRESRSATGSQQTKISGFMSHRDYHRGRTPRPRRETRRKQRKRSSSPHFCCRRVRERVPLVVHKGSVCDTSRLSTPWTVEQESPDRAETSRRRPCLTRVIAGSRAPATGSNCVEVLETKLHDRAPSHRQWSTVGLEKTR